MKKLCLIFAFAVIPSLGFCQFLGDSVIVYINNRVEINLSIPDYDDLKSSNAVVSAIRDFSETIPQLEEELFPETAEVVRYTIGGPITIEPGEQKKIYLNKDGQYINTSVRDKAIINGKNFKMLITTTDLTKITEMPLTNCFQKVIDELPEKTNWSRSLSYDCIDGDVKLLESKNNQLDYLEFNIGAGAGLYKNLLVPDLSLGVGLGLNRKGLIKFPYISSNILFFVDPDRNRKTSINTFLNLGYSWNINKNNNAKMNNRISAELGYLVIKRGSLFKNHTFKLGANWSPGNRIVVNPNLYVSADFGNLDVFTGIRVGFGF